MSLGWIGVDLDGTLAKGSGKTGLTAIGDGTIGLPVPRMVKRVKRWIKEGREVRILTARVACENRLAATETVQRWVRYHIGKPLTITSEKDPDMAEIWDDRARRVERNTGRRIR